MKKVLKFYSQSCSPCKLIQPILEAKSEGAFILREIDIEKHEDLVELYDIMKVPTLVVLDDDGFEVERAVGIPEIMPMLSNY